MTLIFKRIIIKTVKEDKANQKEETDMKKYNLSRIMKRAWELVKRFKETISSALKKAWREAKMKIVNLNGTEKQNAWAQDIIDNSFATIKANVENCKKENEKHGKDIFGARIAAYERIETELKTMLETLEGKVENTAKYIIENRNKFDSRSINDFAAIYETEIRRG